MPTNNAWNSTYPASVPNGGTGVGTVTGILTGNGTMAFTGSAVMQYGTLVAGPSNSVNSLGTGTSGQILTSNGAAANPSYQSIGTLGAITTITGNDSVAESPNGSGNFNIVGTGSITTVGSANTETIELTGLTNHNVLIGAGTATITKVAPSATSGVPLISQGASADPIFGTALVAGGGTGATTFNTNGVVISNTTTTGALAALSLIDGQVVIGSSIGAPAAATLTAGTGISITNGHNSISIAVSGSAVLETLTGNTGGAISPTAGNINTLGTGSITIAGSGSTLTTQLTGLTNHNVLVGAGTATITNVAPSATSGIPLVSNGSSADPSFTTAVVAGGGTGNTTFTAYSVICAGTTATGAFQNVSGVGTAAQVLTSNGAAALPTWQAATAGVTLQQVRVSTTALVHCTTTIPFDDTIPQNTEGTEVFTVAITPSNTAHVLQIQAVLWGGCQNNANGIMALFQDSTANSLAVSTAVAAAAGYAVCLSIDYYMTAGTTSSTTFKIRCGSNSGNFDVNGTGANARVFGGASFASLIVTEYTS